jgi:acetylornithine deacetylase/succinyl-diaminopimelate desuccinylase-like protein
MKWFTVRLIIAMLCSYTSHAQQSLQIIQADTLQHYVQALSHDSTLGRLTSGIGAGKAAMWIADQFQKIGLAPISGNEGFYHVFQHPFRNKEIMGVNVMGAIIGNGRSDKVFIISSHYDHVGTHRNNVDLFPFLIRDNFPSPKIDSIYNGANDNASGVAAMLMLAKYFKELPAPDYSIFFIAFSGEELDMIGSSAFVKSINIQKVKQVINLEMLGRARGRRPDQQLPFVTFDQHDDWVIDSLNKHYALLSGTES